jgi:PIN domain-containing protein
LKIRADEHVSPEVVSAIRQSALSERFTLDSIIEIGAKGAQDQHWITVFGKEGGKAILSADTDFLKRPHQVISVHEAGLAII